jgi:hypothetical protein
MTRQPKTLVEMYDLEMFILLPLAQFQGKLVNEGGLVVEQPTISMTRSVEGFQGGQKVVS